MQLILEPRFLFDASVAAAVKPVAHAAHHAIDSAGPTGHPDGLHVDATHGEGAHGPGFHGEGQVAASATDHGVHPAAAMAQNPTATELLFVDPRVANWQALANGVTGNVQVIILDPHQDAIDQVTRALDGRSGITAINFLAYGTSGSVEIGNAPLNAASLASHTSEIAAWRDHLSANADIMFWSCDVAQGASGRALLADLHSLTGAQVAASTDAIGSAALGGTWTLNAETGPIDAASPFNGIALAAYTGVLDSPVPTVSLAGPASALPGGTFTETVTLTNTAARASGAAPFVEIFAPANVTENAALIGATENGQALTVSSVTLQAAANGQVVAIDPMVRDASGNPEAVVAPAGYHAGDMMYVVRLGSADVAAGASTPIVLTFRLSDASAASTANGLEIAAIGGFQDGGLTVRGTNPTEGNLASDAGNGLATSTSNVAYLSAEAEVTYVASSTGETAALYQLTMTSASALAVNPMHGLEYSVALPSGTTYSGGTITIAGVAAVGATARVVAGSGGAGDTLMLDFPTVAAGGVTTIQMPLSVSTIPSAGGSGIPELADPTTTPASAAYPLNDTTGNLVTDANTLEATAGSAVPGWDGSVQSIQLPQFQTSLGTLTDANLSISGTFEGKGTLGNTAGTGSTTVSSFFSTNTFYLIKPGATNVTANALLSVAGQATDLITKTGKTLNTIPISPGQSISYDSGQITGTQSTTVTDATTLANFYETSGASGNVTFAVIALPSSHVAVSGGNFTSAVSTYGIVTATITYDYTAIIAATASFSAHVYTDSNGNSSQGGGEANLSGVTVTLQQVTGGVATTVSTAVTNSTGDVNFTGLNAGDYQVVVTTPAGDVVTQTTNVATPITLAAGGTANAIEGVYVPATVTAHVYTDSNANSAQDAGEPNLSGVTVKLENGAGTTVLATTTTDASGNVSFGSLAPGSYEVVVTTPTGDVVTETTNVATPLTLASGQTQNAIEGVYAPATVTAHV